MEMKEVNRQSIIRLIRHIEKERGVATAMTEAVRYSLIDEINRLIENGADVNARNESGAVPLMFANDRTVAKILLEHGADVNARDLEGRSPLMWFLLGLTSPAKAEAYVKLLLKSGASPDIVDHDGRNAFELAQQKYGPRVANLLIPPDDKDKGESPGSSRPNSTHE